MSGVKEDLQVVNERLCLANADMCLKIDYHETQARLAILDRDVAVYGDEPWKVEQIAVLQGRVAGLVFRHREIGVLIRELEGETL